MRSGVFFSCVCVCLPTNVTQNYKCKNKPIELYMYASVCVYVFAIKHIIYICLKAFYTYYIFLGLINCLVNNISTIKH